MSNEDYTKGVLLYWESTEDGNCTYSYHINKEHAMEFKYNISESDERQTLIKQYLNVTIHHSLVEELMVTGSIWSNKLHTTCVIVNGVIHINPVDMVC